MIFKAVSLDFWDDFVKKYFRSPKQLVYNNKTKKLEFRDQSIKKQISDGTFEHIKWTGQNEKFVRKEKIVKKFSSENRIWKNQQLWKEMTPLLNQLLGKQ